MQQQLVTVICLCYNHERFVKEAIESVFQQTYPFIQLIVVDDASSDNSVTVIRDLLKDHPDVPFISLKENVGNCKAFNKALPLVKGDFIVDLAADDVMASDRIEQQVSFFELAGKEAGVIFTDATYINADGEDIAHHYEYLFRKGMIVHVPQGDVFSDVLKRYFISSPTMMIRREVMDKLKGYDEELTYEDFDLWVRASREYLFSFLNKRLTKVRKLTTSMSAGWYKKGDPQLLSTYKVCLKARKLLQNDGEKNALILRVSYELRQAVFSENFTEAGLFYGLLRELKKASLLDKFYFLLIKLRLPLSGIRKLYQYLRYS